MRALESVSRDMMSSAIAHVTQASSQPAGGLLRITSFNLNRMAIQDNLLVSTDFTLHTLLCD